MTTPAPDIATLVRNAKSSFYWGMRLLRPERRAAMYALYAFCRILDDVADDTTRSPEAQQADLTFWRQQVAQLSTHTATHPVAQALAAAVRQFGCDVNELSLIIDGVASDLAPLTVAPDWASLRQYCRRVAGAVGVVSVAIFGDRSAAAETFALQLGEALQLTNIIRDVHEDAALGRIYLPREALIQAGIPATLPPALLAQHPHLHLACRVVATEATRQFSAARASLDHCNRHQMLAARLMMERYEHLLRLMLRHDLPPRQRPRLGLLRRLWLVGRHMPQALLHPV